MTTRRRPHGLSGIKRPSSIVDSSSVPSTRARSRQLNAKGDSLATQVSHALFRALKIQGDRQAADQQRQQDQAVLLHYDVQPAWGGDATGVPSTTLAPALQDTQSAGSILGGSGNLPPGFLPPPQ